MLCISIYIINSGTCFVTEAVVYFFMAGGSSPNSVCSIGEAYNMLTVFPAGEKDPLLFKKKKEKSLCPEYDKLYLMVQIQFWRFEV